MLHVVMGVIINAEQHVLIAKRQACKEGAGLWEFPGGKVEANETPYQALIREFQEEIGITIMQASPWYKVSHKYPNREILLDTWLVETFDGIPKGNEGQIIRWVPLKDLTKYEFPAGNKTILDNLEKQFVDC